MRWKAQANTFLWQESHWNTSSTIRKYERALDSCESAIGLELRRFVKSLTDDERALVWLRSCVLFSEPRRRSWKSFITTLTVTSIAGPTSRFQFTPHADPSARAMTERPWAWEIASGLPGSYSGKELSSSASLRPKKLKPWSPLARPYPKLINEWKKERMNVRTNETVLNCTVPYRTVPHCTVSYPIALYCHSTAQASVFSSFF